MIPTEREPSRRLERRDGFLPPYRYTMRWYDLDEETARQWVQDAKESGSTDIGLFDGM